MTKRKSKKHKKSRKGLSGIDKAKNAGKKILEEGSKPLLIVAGLWAGNMAGKAMDKMLPAASDAEPGKFQVKSIVKPLAQLGAGGAIIFFGRKSDLAKSFGYGFAGSGIISGVKLMKPDLFEGLGETEDSGNRPVEAKYYREAKDEIMKLLQDNSFQPALPEHTQVSGPIAAIEESENDSEISGLNVEHAEVL